MESSIKKPWEEKKLVVKNLSLWDENSRIPDYLLKSDENELIQILLKKYKLESFANEIIKDFDLPQIEKIVVWHDSSRNIVLEGNRRLATYKCLIDPSLIKDDDLKTKFLALKSRLSIDENFKLEAVVTNDKKQGMRFIDRKHYHGNNEEKWEQYERDHHIKRTKEVSENASYSSKEKESLFRVNLAEQVKEVDLPDEMKQKILGKGFVTTFYRVVGSTEGRKKLRYERLDYDLKIEDKDNFLSLLKVVIYNLLEKKTLDGKKVLNSRTLNDDIQLKNYLDSISANDTESVDKLVVKQKTSSTSSKTVKKSAQKRGKSKEEPFSSLVNPMLQLPKKCTDKIKGIYHELQTIDVSQCPTASSILVRILVEISTDEFLKKNNDHKKKNDELFKKINHVKDSYVTDQDLKKTIDLLHNELLTKKLNQVAHNTIFQATETSIKDLWKNLEKLFDFLIQGIASK